MLVFPQEGRLDELRRLGISEPVVRLAAGELIHWCLCMLFGPPREVYGWAVVPAPDGPVVVPLLESGKHVYGVREVRGDLEFIEYHTLAPKKAQVVARTEQGFLAWMFLIFPASDDEGSLLAAAEVIGFRHYAEWLKAYDAADAKGEERAEFERGFVERIDRLKTSRDRKRR
jgi:hypothetical protein